MTSSGVDCRAGNTASGGGGRGDKATFNKGEYLYKSKRNMDEIDANQPKLLMKIYTCLWILKN
jgi:hypothetical protein